MKRLRAAIISVAIALLLYLMVAAETDVKAVTDAVVRLGVHWWSVILALSLLNYGLRFLRWHYYLGRLGYHVPIWRNLTIYVAGFAMTMTPGKAGEAVRSVYLRSLGVGYGHSLAAMFAERFADLMTMLLLSLFALLAFSRYLVWEVLALAAVALTLVLIQRPEIVTWLRRRAERPNGGRVASACRKLVEPVTVSASLLRSTPLYVGLALGLIGWGAEGVALYYTAQVLGIDIGLALAIGIYATSILAGAISFIPGGLGGTEVAMGLLLTLAGASPSLAVATTLIVRIATLWFAVVLGALAFAGLEVTDGRRPHIDRL